MHLSRLINRLRNRTAAFAHDLILILLLGGPRLLYRWFKDRQLYVASGKRALIIGAGEAGESLARELLRDRARAYRPVAFVDDDLEKKGREIHGILWCAPR